MFDVLLGQLFFSLKESFWGKEHYMLTKKDRKTLSDNVEYYKKLSTTLQTMFEMETVRFMTTKQFTYKGLKRQVEIDKKLLIAASAAQLTYGLENINLSFFEKIVIHPMRFKNSMGEYVTWDFTDNGEIHISWKAFKQDVERGSHEIVIHIMATMLQIESEKNGWNAWSSVMSPQRVRRKIYIYKKSKKNEKEALFKKEDLICQKGFFVACLVQFYNNPKKFNNRYPILYRNMDLLLHKELSKIAS
ncbi:MAG: zinc-dependent peptidase [Cytophagales bacterium]|nr:zinc-dependent peptidase [Cytophagales bacterium]